MIAIADLILPFVTAQQGGRVLPGTLRRTKEETGVLAAAKRTAVRPPGVEVAEERSDPAQDLCQGPCRVRAIGLVSLTVFEALAA